MIEWEEIRGLAKGAKIDISDLLCSALGAGVYKLSENQYVIAKADAGWDLKSLELVSVYWAVSEQGFRRAYFNDLDNDDNVAMSYLFRSLISRGLEQPFCVIVKKF